MSNNDLIQDILEILRRIDPQKRSITVQTLIFTELDFDSLQMVGLIEAFQERFGIDFFSESYSLEDLRTPATVASAINRSLMKHGADLNSP
jgi:acyl carrier protein